MTPRLTQIIRRLSRSTHTAVLLGFADYLGYPRWARRTLFGSRSPQYAGSTPETGATEYSRTAFDKYVPLQRVRWPLFLLASMPGQVDGKLLIIGPRFESEFHLAKGPGWARKSFVCGWTYLRIAPM